MKPYQKALNQGKELERLTIIHWLESLDQNESWLDKTNELQSIVDALKEQLHKDR